MWGGQFLLLLSGVTIVGYVWNYVVNVDHSKIVLDEGGLKCWFYFFFFLWGYYDHSKGKCFEGSGKSVFCFLLSIVLFYAYKKIGGRFDTMVYLQFIFVPLLLANMLYHARYVVRFLMNIPVPHKIQTTLGYIANLTLDIYIVQVLLVHVLGNLIPFPLNIPFLLLIILLASVANHYLASKVSNVLSSLLK